MARKVIDDTNLPHLVERMRGLVPGPASVDGPGLAPRLPGDRDKVWLGDGEWGEYRGGGSAGPVWLEVDDAGDLYAYYDDNYGEPNLEYDDGTGNLYAIFETEV